MYDNQNNFAQGLEHGWLMYYVLCMLSAPRNLPGSSPQGAFLGIFLFIIEYNGASLRPRIPRQIIDCKKKLSKWLVDNCEKHPKHTHVIYVDDLGEAEAINLEHKLIPDPVTRPLPRN